MNKYLAQNQTTEELNHKETKENRKPLTCTLEINRISKHQKLSHLSGTHKSYV